MDTLHSVDYEIHRNACKVLLGDVQHLEERFNSKTVGVIFNSVDVYGDGVQGDGKRQQQLLSKLRDKRLDRLIQSVGQTAAKIVPTHTATAWRVLFSDAGCDEQSPHADFRPTDKLRRCRDQDFPLSMLIALMPETKLAVWPSSVGWMRDGQQFPIRAKKEVLNLEPGDVLVFRGDLVHAGAAYAKGNFRLFCFLQSGGRNETMHLKVETQPNGIDSISLYPPTRDESPKRKK